MVKQSAFWFDTCPTRRNVASGIVKNVDILIIGGGVVGMTLLHRLIISGFTNTYLVEESTVGFHASGRSSGQLVMRAFQNFVDMDPDIAKEYVRFMAENNSKFRTGLRMVRFDTDMREVGGLRLAIDDDELDTLTREAAFLKEEVEIECPILSQKEVDTMLPGSNFKGGIYVPNEITFNPYKVVNGLMGLVEQKGVRVITNSQVESVTPGREDKWQVSIRHKGTILARHIVYCTNAYSPELLPELSDIITPVRAQMLATDHLPDATIRALPQMSIMCNHGREYFRVYGGRLLVGGMRHAIRGHQENIVHDGDISPAVHQKLQQFVVDRLPFVEKRFTHMWSGIMAMTEDHLPLIGPIPDKPNQYICAGFNGYGFSHALLGGIIIKDYIQSGVSETPGARIFDPARLMRDADV